MTTPIGTHFKNVFSKILEFGFLLESDPKLPSVCSIIAGEPVRGSWWSHPLAQTIFQVNEKLEDHPDVLITKLISGKVTFVHRILWPEIVAIGTAREAWQLRGLSPSECALLKSVMEVGFLRTDQIPSMRTKVTAKTRTGNIARELERRLLIHAEQVHTESGAHAKLMESWDHWCTRKDVTGSSITPELAKDQFEQRLRKLNDECEGTGRLPWNVD